MKEGKTAWSGVHNNLALKYLRSVRKGDLAFFYQTGGDKKIVGIMKALGDAYSVDAKSAISQSKEVAVDVAPVEKLKSPVSLSQIKEIRDKKRKKGFEDFLLLKISRLSVMPVSEDQWSEIIALSRKAP